MPRAMALRRMQRAWSWYQTQLVNKPVRTQIATSALLWATGDAVAQRIDREMWQSRQRREARILQEGQCTPALAAEQRDEGAEEAEARLGRVMGHPAPRIDAGPPQFELKRVCTTGLFGAAFVGPLGHYWYAWLEHFVKTSLQLRPKSTRFIVSKLALDTFIFGPVHLVAFFTWTGLVSGHSLEKIKKDVARDFVPAFLTEATVWPLIQFGNFRFVPVQHQLLFVNVFCLLDSAWLSWLKYEQDAPWKVAISKLVTWPAKSSSSS